MLIIYNFPIDSGDYNFCTFLQVFYSNKKNKLPAFIVKIRRLEDEE